MDKHRKQARGMIEAYVAEAMPDPEEIAFRDEYMPTVRELAAEIKDYADYLEAEFAPEDLMEPGVDEPFGDIRLQVKSSGWYVRTGSAQYDTDHRGFWGASSVSPGASMSTCKDIAEDLIDQALDHAAQNDWEF